MSKHIIITGASRGIGRETAKQLAGLGHRITVIARSGTELHELQSQYPEKIYPVTLDITEEATAGEIRNHLSKHNLTIDGFIHNAGRLNNKPFLEQGRRDWQNQFEVNLMAPAILTKELISFFNKNSHFLTIGSMGGYQGSSKFPGLSVYSATKGGLAILTECLATELAGYAIKCNCLCLGAVQTEMLEQAFPGIQAPVSAPEMAAYISDFILTGHQFYNGQILPVTLGDPD